MTHHYSQTQINQAINCTDGSLVWRVLGFYGREPSAIADGYMVGYNSYDAKIYTFGKGPTQLTVNAPQTGIEYGKSLIISGTITDISSGSKQNEQAARFPNGLPCVSDESMSKWMEYVYMQQPKPENATGVPIRINAIDANNNYRTIGTTVSTTEGYFSLSFGNLTYLEHTKSTLSMKEVNHTGHQTL